MNQVVEVEVGEGGSGMHRRRVPGEPGVWVLVLLDLLIFTLIFYLFAFYRARELTLFDESQRLLSPFVGLVYTVLLLASSWCVAMAVKAVRSFQTARADGLIQWAFYLGAAFAGMKLVEYAEKASVGICPMTNRFFMFYFCMTIIHLVHVGFGLWALKMMQAKVRGFTRAGDPRDRAIIESAAIFWHMVDLVWIVLFALLFLRS